METLLLIIHVLVGAAVCGLVLLQHGKGADMGAAFGSGSSGSLFGASGSANFLSRTTAILAAIFFVTSLGLTYVATHRAPTKGVMDNVKSAPGNKGGAGDKAVPPPAGAESIPAPAPEGSKAAEVPK